MASALRQSSTSALLGGNRPLAQELRRARSYDVDKTTANRVSSSRDETPKGTLTRALSSLFGTRPMEETILCQICFENVPLATALELSACGHRFCQACFKSYLKLKITEGNVSPVCFHPVSNDKETSLTDTAEKVGTTCGVRVAPTQIRSVVDREVFAKYELFRFHQEHKSARECPYCSHSQVCDQAAEETPVCQCVACARTFCYFHGNAHENGTCADFELKHAQTESLSRAAIAQVSKPCPGCSNNVEKAGGCNNMTCIVCKASFCWICGTLFPDGGSRAEHFYSLSFSYCGGMQFTDTGMGIHSQQPWWSRMNTAVDYGLRVVFVSVLEVASVLVYPVAYVATLLLVFVARLFNSTAVTETDFAVVVSGVRFLFSTFATSYAIFFIPDLLLPERVVFAGTMFVSGKILITSGWAIVGPSVLTAGSFVARRVRTFASPDRSENKSSRGAVSTEHTVEQQRKDN